MRHTGEKKPTNFLFGHSSQMLKHLVFHGRLQRGHAMTLCPAERFSDTEVNASDDT